MLLVSGWLIVLAAMVMLHSLSQRMTFVLAGLGVEALGLGLLTAGYRTPARSTE